MCDGDAAVLSNYFDHCFLLLEFRFFFCRSNQTATFLEDADNSRPQVQTHFARTKIGTLTIVLAKNAPVHRDFVRMQSRDNGMDVSSRISRPQYDCRHTTPVLADFHFRSSLVTNVVFRMRQFRKVN